jgi:hypothetical protein
MEQIANDGTTGLQAVKPQHLLAADLVAAARAEARLI